MNSTNYGPHAQQAAPIHSRKDSTFMESVVSESYVCMYSTTPGHPSIHPPIHTSLCLHIMDAWMGGYARTKSVRHCQAGIQATTVLPSYGW